MCVSRGWGWGYSSVPEVRIFKVQGVGRNCICSLNFALNCKVITLFGIGHHENSTGKNLPLFGKYGLRKKTANLVPMCKRLSGSCRQPHCAISTNESNIEPEGKSMYSS